MDITEEKAVDNVVLLEDALTYLARINNRIHSFVASVKISDIIKQQETCINDIKPIVYFTWGLALTVNKQRKNTKDCFWLVDSLIYKCMVDSNCVGILGPDVRSIENYSPQITCIPKFLLQNH